MQYGIIDSTDSWFCVYSDTVLQSPFDSSCLRFTGKTWHRGQEMRTRSYLVINDVYPHEWPSAEDSVTDDLDEYTGHRSGPDTALQNRLKFLQKKQLQLWECEGEFFMNENDSAEYSGRFSGMFHLYFLCDSLCTQIYPAPNFALPVDEPAYYFSGFWKPFHHKELPHLAFFWADTKPVRNEDSIWTLPDIRLQADGSQQFGHWVEFSRNCMLPPDGWCQPIKKKPAPKPVPKPATAAKPTTGSKPTVGGKPPVGGKPKQVRRIY